MVEPSDWRLQGQERYLKGRELCRRTYRRYPKNPNWITITAASVGRSSAEIECEVLRC
jgi:hypothetical protein